MHLCKTVQYLVQSKRWQLWFLSPCKLILPELYISWLVTINKQLFQPTKDHCCVQLHIKLTDTVLSPHGPPFTSFSAADQHYLSGSSGKKSTQAKAAPWSNRVGFWIWWFNPQSLQHLVIHLQKIVTLHQGTKWLLHLRCYHNNRTFSLYEP